ncbi:BAR adaptor protein Hob1 [Elasticomyces elasticus]|uniref:BAR adaptor protein Hob1 n=1 Tax=Exophiala sideris TaxID=1016849 RepID=A0ABR0JPL1_9EURO|nr:BAR adaptor protein Hob1 [Elasticomyces elasticus]KAK5039538.1 BAR adaptor protein Hob1 [Exophiala sideris]KAK5041091.1 BAR adaptor protein Hob1 [Exophiala sideris]KAK5067915.1 BAR adaptor protein Hob1 [Exophiala sideris]KAK5187217.1 BAR adaptor protein Hob1 [Eurotiomycetes sp. CCFEE 6388]
MSVKGFTKSITRAPQQFKQRFNIGDNTKDAVYIDAERRFAELEKETKKLHDESKKYFEAINGMLNHQIEFSQAIQEIYKPISGRVSDPNSIIPEGNPEGIRACEEYEGIVHELQATLKPELEMIEQRVIAPADQLLEVIKVIRKVSQKRQHKQLDYDRHRATLKKLQDKKEKTLKDEKAMYKAENDVEQATQDYEYFNNLLKDELPKLFTLEAEFIRPLFQSFYYMQLNVFYTLHDKMQAINIGYFNLNLDIEEAFEMKRGDVQDRAEELSIVHFKSTGGVKVARGASKYSVGGAKAKEAEASGMSKYGAIRKSTDPDAGVSNPPPPYSPAGSMSSMPGSPALGAVAAAKGKPPPPKPKPSRLSGVPAAETVTALYDYEAQAEGDLSFMTGDVIEIISRTQNENEWWNGRVHGRQGQFPGNYVRLN